MKPVNTIAHTPDAGRLHRRVRPLAFGQFFVLISACLSLNVMGQNLPCKFNADTFQFAGKPMDQAKCLLRPNFIGGVLGEQLKELPHPLHELIGKKVKVRKDRLKAYLRRSGIDEATIGGPVDDQLAKAVLPSGEQIQSLYFVIHDTSSPFLKDEPFPEGFDFDQNWRGNKLGPRRWRW